MNEMNTLRLYRLNNMWVYDDPAHGREAEPFVLGASEALDELRILDDLGPGTNPFDIIFSAQPFPEAHAAHRRHDKDGSGGAWYQFDQRTFWLCPALLDFFESPPESLYVKAQAIESTLLERVVSKAASDAHRYLTEAHEALERGDIAYALGAIETAASRLETETERLASRQTHQDR